MAELFENNRTYVLGDPELSVLGSREKLAQWRFRNVGPAWVNAVRVWLELHTRYNGGNNGAVRLSFAEAAEALGIGKATAGRAFVELQDKGFIVLAKQGNWYHRQAHEWRLTTKSMQKVKGKEAPTNDWRSWHPRKKTERGSRSVPSARRMVP